MVHEIQSDIIESYNEDIKEGTTVIEMFAPWCKPCNLLAPIFEKVSEEIKGATFHKFNIDTHKPVAKMLEVKYIPTIIVCRNGIELNRMTGLVTEEKLTEWILSVING